MAWHKGERGHEITWIGVTIKIRWEDKLVFLEVPAKMFQEILSELENILEASMVTVRRLRSIAGRAQLDLRGCAAVALGSLHGPRGGHDKDVAEGIEEQRSRCRLDSRDKAALVATKRCAVCAALGVRPPVALLWGPFPRSQPSPGQRKVDHRH